MSQSEGNDSSLERARFPLYHHSKKNKKKGEKSSMRRHLSDNKMETEEEVSKGGGSDTDGNVPAASDLPLCVPHLLAPAPVPCQSVITKSWSSPTPASSLQISGPSGTMPSISSRKEVQALPKRNEYTSASIPKTVVCFICKEWFFSREKFIIHLVMNHRMVHCRHCQEIFETDDMRILHEREVHFPLECDICKCTVESTKELAEHYESDHDVRTCLFCGVLVKPKSYYSVHLGKKHFVSSEDALSVDKVSLVKHWNDAGGSAWTFNCYLCGKERKKVETFGHFFSYHRFSLVCLLEQFASERINFIVQGSPAPPSLNCETIHVDTNSFEEATKFAETLNSGISAVASDEPCNDQTVCTFCSNTFSVQVPKSAHDLFCLGMSLCKFCDQVFPTKVAKDTHVFSCHTSFHCVLGCSTDIKFVRENQLVEHYLLEHKIRECYYCQALVSTSENKFSDHLKSAHACCRASICLKSKDSDSDNLFQVVSNGTLLTVICSLCNSDISSLVRNIVSLFKHLHYHKILLKPALHLLEVGSLFQNRLDSGLLRKERIASKIENMLEEKNRGKHLGKSNKIMKGHFIASTKSKNQRSKSPGKTSLTAKSKKEDSNFGDQIDGSEKFNSDSSFEPSSDEFLVGSGGENEELSDDEEEEWKPDVIANLNDEPIEAQIDPTEVECVMNDTSDDEFYDDTSPILADNEGSDNFISNMQINQEKIEAMIDSLNTGLDEASHEKSAETSSENLRKISTLSSGESQPLTLDTDTVEDQIEKLFQDPSKTTEQLGEPATSNGKVASRESWEAADVLMAIKQEPGTDVDGNFSFPSPKKNGKEMFCEICCGPCPGLEELLQHLNTVHNFSIMALGGESRFTCIEECDKIFNSQALLDKHKKEVHNITKVTTTFQCPFCAVQAETKITVRQHIFDFHNNDLMSEPPQRPFAFPCRCCAKKFWHVEERNQHQMDEHSDTIESFFKCYICLQSYTSKVCLNRHVLTTHPGEQRYSPLSYKCKLCLVMFPSVAKMCKHFQDSHPAALVFLCRFCNMTLKTKKTLKTHIKNMHSQARQRECHLCGKMLLSKRAYAIHFRMKHSAISRVGFRCRICQKRFDSKDERKLHYQMDHEGESPYHCTDCGKGFASKSGMYGHRQLHTGTGVSTCGYCGKAFTRKDSYNEHLLIHNGPRHKCPHCPKEFVQRSNLVRHIRIHTGEKPYKCLYCDKCFSDKGACNSHIRVHTREETSSCPYCGQTYSKKQKLKYHIRKHTGEGLITCEICNKQFTNSFALKEHRIIHDRQTQILCRRCGKAFNSEKYLQRHVALVHEPSHMYNCPLCSKAFSLPGRLKAHIMTHTGVKHMKCLLCDKAYSVRKSLRKHLLEKHNVGHDHPHYKRCFYAMSPEEAGLDIPSDIPRVRVSPAGSEDEPAIPIFRKQEVKKKVKKPRGTGRRGRPPGSGKKQKQSGDPSLVTSPKRGRGRGRGRGGGRGRGRGRPPKSLSIVASSEPSTSTGRESQRVLRRKPSPKKFEIKQEPDSEEDSDSNNMLSMALQDEKSHSSTDSYEEKITKKRSVGNRKISPMEYHSSAPTLSPENKEMLLNLVGATGQKKRRVEAIVEILQKYTNTGAEGNSKDGTGEDIKDEDQRQETRSRHDKESTEDRGSSDEGEGLVGNYTKVDVQVKIKEEECSLGSSSGSSVDQQDVSDEAEDNGPVLARFSALDSPKVKSTPLSPLKIRFRTQSYDEEEEEDGGDEDDEDTDENGVDADDDDDDESS